jgi:hypothetical protein
MLSAVPHAVEQVIQLFAVSWQQPVPPPFLPIALAAGIERRRVMHPMFFTFPGFKSQMELIESTGLFTAALWELRGGRSGKRGI